LTTYIQRSSQVAKNATMVKLVNDIFVRCKPLSHSPQHVVAAGKKRDLHLEFVLLCLLVKNLPLCKRQKLTGNNAQLFYRHTIETTFVSIVVQMPSTFTTTLSKIKTEAAFACRCSALVDRNHTPPTAVFLRKASL